MASRTVMDAPFCQTASSLIQDMVSSPVSVQVKDVSKRKRVNRNAKLKQCKLDARREQWLAQVTGKHGKAEDRDQHHSISLVDSQNPNDPGELVNPTDHENSSLIGGLEHQSMGKSEGVSIPSHLVIERQDCHHQEENSGKENLEVRSCMSECSEVGSSPKSCGSQSPKSKITRWAKEEDIGRFGGEFGEESYNKEDNLHSRNLHNANNAELKPDGSQMIMSGTKSNLHSYVDSSYKDEEEGIESVDDDWEAAADALELNCIQDHSDEETQIRTLTIQNAMETPEYSSYTTNNRPLPRTQSQPRAWRPDDECRPSSLPSLSKQNSFPPQTPWKEHLLFNNHDGDEVPQELLYNKSVPSLCPICAEELDQTDSSFEPCSCGFQLCLFCHHRIAGDDGRCPGCRNFYVAKPVASRNGIRG